MATVRQLTFTGGEPFMAERFKELVLYSRMKKANVSVITNGNVGTFYDYRQLKNLGVSLFELPIHSASSGPHDEMTGTKDSWKKSVQSVNDLLNIGANVVAVVVITKINYTKIAETLTFINSLGISRIMLNRFNIGGQGIREAEKLSLSKAEINRAFAQASEVGKTLKLGLSSNVCTPLCFADPAKFPNIRFSTCSPEVSKRPLTLSMNGDLRFCNHSPVVLGNIFHSSFEKMFASDEAQLWNNSVPDLCTDCSLYSKCMAGCRAASQQMGNGLNIADPVVYNL